MNKQYVISLKETLFNDKNEETIQGAVHVQYTIQSDYESSCFPHIIAYKEKKNVAISLYSNNEKKTQ